MLEHIDISAVEALKRIGVDVYSVQELNMRGESDKNLLAYAKENEMVVVTRAFFLTFTPKVKNMQEYCL